MQPTTPSIQSGSQHQMNPITNDPNSVETFKQNMQMILEYVVRTQNIAPDLASLQQNLHLISDMMRHSGVGALPLLAASPPPVATNDVSMSQEPAPPTEDEMVAQATRSIEVLYDRLRKVQEAAGVVGSLLGSGQPVQSQLSGFMVGSQGGTPSVPIGLGGVSSGSQSHGRSVSGTGSDGRAGSQAR
ncbi:hypothetical protein L218DRAFT_850674 [Marasmius fiardii PR-910]|nr:hypothetical protein L218DRAFT_850674 [Marasmius fiardii PR-910]